MELHTPQSLYPNRRFTQLNKNVSTCVKRTNSNCSVTAPLDFAREIECSPITKTLSARCSQNLTAHHIAIPSTTLTSANNCAYLHFFAKSFSILFVRYPYGFVDSRHYSQQTRNSNMAAQAERRYYEEESFHCNTIEDRVLSHYRRQ